jgi:LuxR family maltose regulon positive regulatory protein
LCGPLCDAVLETTGSAGVLASSEASNLLVVPLDRRREWYRYHQLFRELLTAELNRREPELVPRLHARAAAWFEANNLPEEAVGHAQAAGDADRAARLVEELAQPAYAGGRAETARRWLGWFEKRGVIERFPVIAVLGGEVAVLFGQPAAAERLAETAERALAEETLPGRELVEANVSLLRALMCRDGVARMRADARLAWDRLEPGDAARALARLLEGISYLVDGDADRADPILAHAVDLYTHIGGMPGAATATADSRPGGDLAPGLGCGRQAGAAGTRDHAGRPPRRLHHEPACPCRRRPHGPAPRRRRGRQGASRARRSPAAAAHLRRPAHRRPGAAGAGARLPDAGRCRRRQNRPAAGPGHRPVAPGPRHPPQPGRGATRTARCGPRGTVGPSSLTTAELRLLPFLPSYLGYREIGERLHVSRHTVKSQAASIYRKLGVSSRAEAMMRLQALGLLGS